MIGIIQSCSLCTRLSALAWVSLIKGRTHSMSFNMISACSVLGQLRTRPSQPVGAEMEEIDYEVLHEIGINCHELHIKPHDFEKLVAKRGNVNLDI